jgi:hypothetical protein
MRTYKTWQCAAILGYVALSAHYIPRMPADQRPFTTVVAVVFFLLYLLVPALFGARVEAGEDGLRVEQYRNVLIPYSEITRCYSFFLFPVQLAILVTKRRLPLGILLAGDRVVEKRRSLIQDGELAALVKSRMGFR